MMRQRPSPSPIQTGRKSRSSKTRDDLAKSLHVAAREQDRIELDAFVERISRVWEELTEQAAASTPKLPPPASAVTVGAASSTQTQTTTTTTTGDGARPAPTVRSNSTSSVFGATSAASNPSSSSVLSAIAAVLHGVMVSGAESDMGPDSYLEELPKEVASRASALDERSYVKKEESRNKLRWKFASKFVAGLLMRKGSKTDMTALDTSSSSGTGTGAGTCLLYTSDAADD